MSGVSRAAHGVAASTLALFLALHTAAASPTTGEDDAGEAAPAEVVEIEGVELEGAELEPVDREEELECLATAIYHEARGEPAPGQLVVGRVILNRVASPYYPATICDVVYQNVHLHNRCQFSFACDGIPKRVTETKVWQDIQLRAEWLVYCVGDNDCEETKRHWDIWASTHYHADYVHPFWAEKLARMGQIGRHIFYYTPTM